MQGINFIAIDFETATGKRASICEAGICVVRNVACPSARKQVQLLEHADTRHPPE